MTALIVEDEAVSVMLFRRFLNRLGHTVVAATAKGEEVQALAEAHNPELVLMDISLAGEMNGIEAATKLREISDAPVLYLTGYSADEIRTRALQVSNSFFLVKPVVETQLSAAIEALPPSMREA